MRKNNYNYSFGRNGIFEAKQKEKKEEEKS